MSTKNTNITEPILGFLVLLSFSFILLFLNDVVGLVYEF